MYIQLPIIKNIISAATVGVFLTCYSSNKRDERGMSIEVRPPA